jgi:hypothetical protein
MIGGFEKNRTLRENYERFEGEGERRRITCCNLKVSDKGRAKGIIIGLKRVGKNKQKRAEEDEGTNRINEINRTC